MCSFGSCKTRFEFLSQFRKVRNAFECFVTQVQTHLPKTKRVWPMKINVICTVRQILLLIVIADYIKETYTFYLQYGLHRPFLDRPIMSIIELVRDTWWSMAVPNVTIVVQIIQKLSLYFGKEMKICDGGDGGDGKIYFPQKLGF